MKKTTYVHSFPGNFFIPLEQRVCRTFVKHFLAVLLIYLLGKTKFFHCIWWVQLFRIFILIQFRNFTFENEIAFFQSVKIYFIPHLLFEGKIQFYSQILHQSSVPSNITLLYFFSSNVTYFVQKEPMKVHIFETFKYSRQNLSNSSFQF